MSSTVHFGLLRDPKLVDVVDEEWEKEVLPEDGAGQPVYDFFFFFKCLNH
jgi:hypothetical protein